METAVTLAARPKFSEESEQLAPALWRALDAERLKLRRSLALVLAFVGPLVLVALQCITFYNRGQVWLEDAPNHWLWFGEQTMMLWALLMMPLFITLQAALLANLDHSARAWKHCFAQPISRTALYAAKLIGGTLLIGLSLLLLVVFMVLGGLILNRVYPELHFEAEIPWVTFLAMAGLMYVTSWFLIALHSWVALRWNNFVVPSAFGIAMTVSGVIVINSDRWAPIYPWTLPAMFMYSYAEGEVLRWLPFLLGCVGGIVVAIVGGWEFVRRDVL